jgi:hypothetical protein
MMKVDRKRYRLLHSFTGRQIAQADRLNDFKDDISAADAGRYTVHDRRAGWFASASMIFTPEELARELKADNTKMEVRDG